MVSEKVDSPFFSEDRRTAKLQYEGISADTDGITVANGKSVERSGSREVVDSGSAWIVCAAVCLINITTDGFCFTLGVIFPILLNEYGQSALLTSWVGSILTGMMMLSGPLIGYLLMKWGARVVCFVGALLAAAGTAISMFATSVLFLIFSLGVLTGK